MSASCPSCGAAFVPRNPGIVTAVCEFCGSVFWWEEDDLLAAGERSVLGEGFTRLFRGAVGELHNLRFRVLGRVRYAYPRGFWDEWYVALDNGDFTWITEDDHELAQESPLPGARVPSSPPRPGERLVVGDEEFHFEEVGEAECIGLEGELPEKWEIGERYAFADASSLDGRATLSLEFDGPTPTVFRGRWLPHRALRVDETGGPPPDTRLGGDALRFVSGRARPPHEPRTTRCASCASPVSVQDEAARMVVCASCGTPLALDEAEARAIGARSPRKPPFTLAIGAPITWKGDRYEVVARMAFQEEDDDGELTLQYLLYSPVAGSFWIDGYRRAWTVTWATHTVPLQDPMRAGRVQTGDGRAWTLVERGEYETLYLDGALPWVAKVGDRVRYAELTGAKDGVFEMQVDRGEIEFAEGVSLSPQAARALLGDAAGPAPGSVGGVDLRRLGRSVMAAALVALVVQCGGFSQLGDGETRLAQRFTPDDLAGEALSEPFTVVEAGAPVQVHLVADALHDQWMDVDVALIEGDDAVVHVTDAEVSYYSGYEDGESWTEGNIVVDEYVSAPHAGVYRVLVQAVGGAGESLEAGAPPSGVAVTVTEGARPKGLVAAGMALAGVMIGVGFLMSRAGRAT